MAKKEEVKNVNTEMDPAPLKTEAAQATPSEFDGLQADMISIARKMCAEISDGSARDYYKHIDSIIKLHNAVRPTSVTCLA